MLKKSFNFLNLGGDYQKFIKSARDFKKCSVFGLSQPERVLSALSVTGKVLYLTGDFASAQKMYESFLELEPNKTFFFPAGTDVLTYKYSQSLDNNISRITTLYSLVSNKADIVVAPIDGVLSYAPSKKDFSQNIISFKKGIDYDYNYMAQKLVSMGYRREGLVSAVGEFSLRGDILDIYPLNHSSAYRLEFFDVQLESIKKLNLQTNRSEEEVDRLDICPCTNIFLTKEEVDVVKTKLNKLNISLSKKQPEIEIKDKFDKLCSDLIYKLDNNEKNFSLDYLFPLIEKKLETIFDYIPEDFTVVIDESKMVNDILKEKISEYSTRKKELSQSGEILDVKESGIVKRETILSKMQKFRLVANQKITSANEFFDPDVVYSFKTSRLIKYSSNFNAFINDLNGWLLDGYKVFICAGDDSQAKKLKTRLESNNIYLGVNKYAGFDFTASAILPYTFTSGFVVPENKIVVVGTYDILPKKAKQLAINRRDVFSVPKVGDYVVHLVHGIGLCEGVTKLTGSFGTKDYVVVKYRDNDKLYVPIDQLDMLDRFSGGETPKRLSKIGGAEFSAVKERVKKNIKQMAFDLLTLYAQRESKQGFCFVKDDELQLEFENSFPYVETEDQLKAIAEIKKDMMSNKVMDRLLCGDVGFGKTEVALRAIFKAVLSGKQVAFLAPTTILSEQHYNTCKQRFREFDINVKVLNRFRTKKETNEVLAGVKSGLVNVLCGTHRLLSSDVEFDNLGLVVLDEEHKFGVEDKEKIKLKHKGVDFLTLSATPIPRTLHMSLSGIRDISVISTPPTERIPVLTSVVEYSDKLIKDAIEKELRRGGQVFLVYNRVETIDAFAQKIRELVPNAKIVVGHGQLKSSELENVIYQFYNKMADVLISTTIIENGIDVTSANCLIVIDSDRFGLSQLYQIRGRVGRGNKEAYAYFTFKGGKVLTEDGYKRLDALTEFTEFGSGFKIAMRDLEIRGSGNVLGAEQHGHIQKIGYELYSKMLQNAIDELKGKKVQEEKEVLIKINIDAFIPESYINSTENRMATYKNISRIESIEDRELLVSDLEDVYGKIPLVVKNLIDVAYIKALARNLGITEIQATLSDIKMVFGESENKAMSPAVANAIYKYYSKTVLNLGELPTIVIKNRAQSQTENFMLLKDFLIISNENKKSD